MSPCPRQQAGDGEYANSCHLTWWERDALIRTFGCSHVSQFLLPPAVTTYNRWHFLQEDAAGYKVVSSVILAAMSISHSYDQERASPDGNAWVHPVSICYIDCYVPPSFLSSPLSSLKLSLAARRLFNVGKDSDINLQVVQLSSCRAHSSRRNAHVFKLQTSKYGNIGSKCCNKSTGHTYI